MTWRDMVVIGGGVAGLAAALRLAERSEDRARVTLLEATPRAGGHARTRIEHGFVVEEGPNGYLETDEMRTLTRRLGLETRRIEARPESKRRWIARGGRLREVPMSPPGLLMGDALSVRGRLRVLREPWVRSASAPGESVFDFARRRLGREAAEILVDAAVAGISAGDSRTLEIESAFPSFVAMEREHGSLLRAMLRGPRGAGRRLVSFPRGVGELVAAMTARLGDRLRAGARAQAVRREGLRWVIEIEGQAALNADAVLIASPASAAARLLGALDERLARSLAEIAFSGVAVVSMAYAANSFRRPLDGYGFLIPGIEGGRTLGAVWESSLFEGRAPEGHALIRVMIGGARDPQAMGESEDQLVERARYDLARLMNLTALPKRIWVSRWPGAIAQYSRGHSARVAAIREAAACHPALALCGTSYDGISLGAAVASGEKAADALLESVGETQRAGGVRMPETAVAGGIRA